MNQSPRFSLSMKLYLISKEYTWIASNEFIQTLYLRFIFTFEISTLLKRHFIQFLMQKRYFGIKLINLFL